MPDQKITDLVDGGLPQPTDDFVVARGATNNKIAWSSMSGGAGGVAIVGSDATFTSGTVDLTGVGGGVTVGTNVGQQIEISVAAPISQTVQTQNAVDLTLSGNLAGVLALVSSGTATLAGGNNITLSQAGNAITISGPNIAGAQTGISGLANSETTYTSGTVSLSELGGITIRSSAGQIFQIEAPATSGLSATGIVSLSTNGSTISVGAPAYSAGISTNGNTSGDTGYASQRLNLVGGNNITLSGSTNGGSMSLTISGPNIGGAQTGISGISASDTLYTSGSVRFTGSQAVTVRSGTGQLVVIDVPVQSTQVETQTFLGGVAGSNTTYTSGTALFTGVGGGVTVSSNTGQRIDISVAAPVAQTNQAGSVYASSNTFGTSSGTYDARSLSIAGRGAVSVAASNSGWIISAPAQTAQSGISAIYDGANSISTGTVSMANANGVSFSVNANTLSASVNQSVSMFAVSNTTQSTSGTAHKSALSFAGAGGVSVGVSGGSVVISGGAGGGFSGGVSTGGNTAGATGITGTQNVFVGVTPISLSQTTGANGGTISILAPATSSLSATGIVSISTNGSTISIGVPAQTNQTGGVYASSNTFGTSSGTYDARSISIAGSGAVSVAASNSGWVVSAPAQSTQTEGIIAVGVSTGGNSSGDTGVASGTRLVFAGGSNITLSQATAANATTITISGATAAGAAMGTASQWPFQPQSTVTAALVSYFATGATRTTMTAYVAPFAIEGYLSVNQMRVPAHVTITSANTNSNWSWTCGHSMGIYTLTGSTLSLLSSFSFKQQISYASTNNSTNASATWSASWGSGTDVSSSLSLSTNNAGVTGFWSSISSVKQYPMFSGAVSMSPGQYFNAWVFSSATAGSVNASLLGVGINVAVSSQQAAQDIGMNVSSTTATQPLGGLVSMTQTDTAMPASILTADMSTAGAVALAMNRSVYFNLNTRLA